MPESAPRPLLCAVHRQGQSGEYHTLIEQAISLFEGDAQKLERELTEKMNEAAEEAVQACRVDRLAIQKLGAEQHVVAGAFAKLDVIAFVQGQTRACVCVLHYSGGTLQDKEYTFFHVTESDPAEVLSSFIKQYAQLQCHEIEGKLPCTFHPSQSARWSWPCRSAANAEC